MQVKTSKNLIAALAMLAAAPAFAQQSEFIAADADFTPSQTRAAVVNELNQAYAAGTLVSQQHDGANANQVASSRSRSEVVAELNQAYRDGALATQQRDGAQTIQFAGHRSRSEVRQEALAANQNQIVKSSY
jgi:hypothetical protein